MFVTKLVEEECERKEEMHFVNLYLMVWDPKIVSKKNHKIVEEHMWNQDAMLKAKF